MHHSPSHHGFVVLAQDLLQTLIEVRLQILLDFIHRERMKAWILGWRAH